MTTQPPSGAHWIDVRIDDGGWILPAGTKRVAEDYAGEVEIFVVT